MKRRRTIELIALVEEVNRRNRESTVSANVRQGWNSLLEAALMARNAYAGFGYYDASQLAEGMSPGIRTDAEGNNTFPDETRRFYYVAR